jgi:hypothetical protein
VAEQHRHRSDPAPVDNRQVGVAHPGGFDADEQFTRAGRVQVEVTHHQRPGFGVRPFQADLFEYGAADPHDYSLPAPRLTRQSAGRFALRCW